MKFLELNKKRHAVKTFNDRPVDYKDLRTAIEVVTLTPSANNIQPQRFVVVEDKKAELVEHPPGISKKQVEQTQYIAAIFTDTDLVQRSYKIVRISIRSLSNDMLGYYMETLPARFAESDGKRKGEYLAPSTGIVAMDLILTLTDQNISSNIILGFDKSSTNDVLEVDKRFRPELLITVGYDDNKPELSYRLPVDEIIGRR